MIDIPLRSKLPHGVYSHAKLTGLDNTCKIFRVKRRPTEELTVISPKERVLLEPPLRTTQGSRLCTAMVPPKSGSGSANTAVPNLSLLERVISQRFVIVL